jgi:hypothetical protein
MKCYLFCAGGCGARALEAIVHLCAPGLGPDEIKVLMIDPDANGGNLHLTNDIINSYNGCQAVYGAKLGEEQFFKTKLSLFATEGQGVAGAWNPVNAGHQFGQMLGYGVLTPAEKQIADLLFTEDERQMNMNVGFLGHPAVGAAALSLLPLYGASSPWGGIASQLTTDLANGPVNVVIAGSVFGGTGASVFFPLANWLRRVAGGNIGRLKVAALALAPYFSFPPSDGVAAAAGVGAVARAAGPDARKFPLATRAAAQFYDQMRQIMRQIGTWPFSAMFWLGDDTPVVLGYCAGGAAQENPPHFVELLAAQAALDFFDTSPAQNCCYYAGSGGVNNNVVGWADLPRIPGGIQLPEQKRRILKLLVTGLMHSDFYSPLFQGGPQAAPIRPETIPWNRKYFLGKKCNLSAPPHVDQLNAFSGFSARHIVWWEGIHRTTPDRLRLLNTNAFRLEATSNSVHLDSNRMKNLEYPDNPDRHGGGQTEFHDMTCKARYPKGASDGSPAYLALLAQASAQFVKKYYGV